MPIVDKLKTFLKKSPIPLSKNHLYDIQTKKIIAGLSKDANCIDVGCYRGEMLDLMLAAAPEGIHFAIEPVPVNCEYIRDKFSDNANCHILNFAASNVKGKANFNYVLSNPSYSGLKKRTYDRAYEKDINIEVLTDKLDNQIPSDVPIHLIKIDVEGAELLVLEGARNLIAKNKPIVVFEHGLGASDVYGAGPEELYSFFNQLDMCISNLGTFVKGQPSLDIEAFKQQYLNKRHYYFVAHACK
jgi:FkbM family methyltransferase